MKSKDFFINFLLSTFPIIFVPLLFSAYDYFLISKKNDIQYIENKRIIEEDLPQKILALEKGYMPQFYPVRLIENKNLSNIYPIGSLPNKFAYYCNEGYDLIKFKTDRFGLRNKDTKWESVANKSNIFTIGDSFTHGACVPGNSTIASNVEDLSKINTINLGMGGSGPYEYMAVMKTMLNPIISSSNKKNTVLLIFYDNDNVKINNRKEKLLASSKSIVKINQNDEIFPTKYYTKNLISFIKENYPTSKELMISEVRNNSKELKIKLSPFYKILTLQPIRKRIIQIKVQKYHEKNKPNFSIISPSQKAISLLSDICKNNCTPNVVYIPNNEQWRPNIHSKLYKNKLKKITKDLGINFIDTEEVIDKYSLKDYAPKGIHLSIDGYRKVSKLITEKIGEL